MTAYETEQSMVYEQEELWFPLSEDILAWDEDFHRLMLNDQLRMNAYETSVKQAVQPGMTVVDIGTGTGILAKWALEAGAERVYGIELNPDRAAQAIQRMREAGKSDKFEIHNALSYNVDLPERVDMILSEILGNLGDNEDMVPVLNDARTRFLKKDGIIMPAKVSTYLVPVDSAKLHSQVRRKKCRSLGGRYDLDDLLTSLNIANPFDLYFDAIIPQSVYLANIEKVAEFNFDGKDDAEYSKDVMYAVTKAGSFSGFKGAFDAELCDGVRFDIRGENIVARDTSDCLKHCYLPIEDAVDVKEGDVIHLNFSRFYPESRLSAFHQGYSWRGTVKRNGDVIADFAQSTCAPQH